jgi:hypothetical protein
LIIIQTNFIHKPINGVLMDDYFAISLYVAALCPYLKQTVDGYIATEDKQGLLY